MPDEQPALEMSFSANGVVYRLWGSLGPGGPELEGVEISGRRLGADDLRQPLLSTFVTNFSLTEGEVRDRRVRRGRPRDPMTAGHRLEEVARIARNAPYGARGKLVASHFGISHGYARQLISQASRDGFQTR